MARIATRLVGPAAFATSTATLYTVAAAQQVIIRQIHISNPAGTPYTFTICVGADAAALRIFNAFQIPAAAAGVTASVFDWYGYLVLTAAEILTGFASNVAVTYTVMGDVCVLS